MSDERIWPYALGGLLNLLFWTLALAVVLWLVRRFFPRYERLLFDPIASRIRNPTLRRWSGWLISLGLMTLFWTSVEFVKWLRGDR